MAFDLKVHHRDPKSGKITRENLYAMECHGAVKFYRRDGKCFDAAGVEIEDPKANGKLEGIMLSQQPFTRSAIARAELDRLEKLQTGAAPAAQTPKK